MIPSFWDDSLCEPEYTVTCGDVAIINPNLEGPIAAVVSTRTGQRVKFPTGEWHTCIANSNIIQHTVCMGFMSLEF